MQVYVSRAAGAILLASFMHGGQASSGSHGRDAEEASQMADETGQTGRRWANIESASDGVELALIWVFTCVRVSVGAASGQCWGSRKWW